SFNLFADDRLNDAFLGSGDHASTNGGVFAVTRQQPHDGDLASPRRVLHTLPSPVVHVACFATDVGFIHFNVAADLAASLILHGEPNSMEHEPCGLLSHANRARQFVAADPVLRIGDEPHGDEPLVEADGAVFHDGADLDR